MSPTGRGIPFARWLAILVAFLVLAPTVGGITGWVIARDVQKTQERSRARTATDVISNPHPLNPAWMATAVARLQRLGIPAHLVPTGNNHTGGSSSVSSHAQPPANNKPKASAGQRPGASGGVAATSNFKPAQAPITANADRYQRIDVHKMSLDAVLLIPRGNPTVPWLVALATGFLTFLAAIAVASVTVRRWIARPLSQLASGAEQIAAGDLQTDLVRSPVREITLVGDAQHGMARSLAEAVHTARAADRERQFLISAIAHDLRTPLFTLRGSLEAIELGIGDREALKRAQQKAAHLDQLVSDLFTFSRLEYAPAPHRQHAFDVRDTAQHAIDSVVTLTAAETRTITLQLPDHPIVLRSDETAVERILTNLLANAIGHADQHVQLRVHSVRGQVTLEISDDGPGFAPQHLPHIFEPLYRADSSRTNNDGAGLGLTIVHRLATALGGNVTATNRTNHGALVVVALPAG